MSVDKVLADARPRRLDPDHRPDPAPLMAHPRPSPVRRPRVRRMVLVPAVAAAVAAGVVVLGTQTVSDNGPPAAHTTSRSASELLLVAAKHSAAAQVDDGRYWVTNTEFGTRHEVGPEGGRYAILTRDTAQLWLATDPDDPSLTVYEHLGAAPAGPSDEAAWRADGSPSRWPEVDTEGAPSGRFHESAPGPREIVGYGAAVTESTEVLNSPKPPVLGAMMLGGKTVSKATLDALPTEPPALRAALLQHRQDPAKPPLQEDWVLFWSTRDLVLNLPVPPAVRAAAYRVMAELEEVTLLGPATDQRGRPGEAVAFVEHNHNGSTEYRLILDPATGQAFATEDRNAAGELIYYQLTDATGFRDDNPPTE